MFGCTLSGTRIIACPLVAGLFLASTTASSVAQFSVDSYLVVDFHTKKILSEHHAGKKRQVASLTKIATAMVTLDWATATEADMSQRAIVPPAAASIGGPNPMGLQPGDAISLRDALFAAISASDNLCALTLANHIGGDLLARSGKRGDPVKEFVKQMNALAVKQGATNTRFTNPHGMDHLKPVPHSTAKDMARLALYAMGKAGFTFYCSQKQRKISYHRGAQKKSFVVKNTNKVLGLDSIDGVKTGLTRLAGPCVVVSAEKPSTVTKLEDGRSRITHHRLVVVVLGAQSPDARFDAARSLLRRGWEKYDAWLAAGRRIADRDELLSTGG